MNSAFRRVAVLLRNSFIAGIAVLLPAVVTIVILRYLINLVNAYLLNPALSLSRFYLGLEQTESVLLAIKGGLFLLILVLIVGVGVAARTFIVKRTIHFGEQILSKIPLINKIYTAIQQIAGVFLLKKQNIFQRVVLIEYPRRGMYSLGLLTSESKGEVQHRTDATLVNIFIPTTPNPTSGLLVMVPHNELIELTMSVEDALKLIISGGAVTPDYHPQPTAL